MLPMWLSLAFAGMGGWGPTSGASCALVTVTPAARTKLRIALKKCTRFKLFIVGILMTLSKPANLFKIHVYKTCPPADSFSLEVEVKPKHQLTGVKVRARR